MGENAEYEGLDYRSVKVLEQLLQLLECLLVEQQWNVVSLEQKTGTGRIRGLLEESRLRRHFESLVVF